MKATHNKGVYNLNPTKAVMKQGSQEEREKSGPVRVDGNRMPEAHESPADTANLGSARAAKKAYGEGHISDFYGVESEVHHSEHPAMQTRAAHSKNHKHTDGRKHEDHHHAVRQAKGK